MVTTIYAPQPGGNPHRLPATSTAPSTCSSSPTTHAGMISISDDRITRILGARAALELAAQIVRALGGRLVPPAGPLTGVM